MNRRTALTSSATLAASLGAFGTLGGAVPARGRSGADASLDELSDDEISRWLRLANFPSMSMAQVDGDRITTRAIGVRRKGEPAVVDPDTAYAAASLTMSAFAYTFLSFVEDGAISLDRPVREYLPLPDVDDARARSITARHLLSHSGGWRNWRNSTSDTLVANFDPGARWSYSGEGYFFLQRVLERVTGKAIGTLVRERVFEPPGCGVRAFSSPRRSSRSSPSRTAATVRCEHSTGARRWKRCGV
jgi:CubicO group peptidase (beta-lactamase class C family)